MPNLKRLLHSILLPRVDLPTPYDRYDPMSHSFSLFQPPRTTRVGDPRRLKLELEILRYLP